MCVYVCALLCLDRGLSRIKTECVCMCACMPGQKATLYHKVCCSVFYKNLCLSLTPSSSEPLRGAGERGRQVCGGDGSETDANSAGLREKMINAQRWRGTWGGWIERERDGEENVFERPVIIEGASRTSNGWMDDGRREGER